MNHRPPTDEERIDWLRLTRSENVGPMAFRRLLARFGTAEAALAALPDLTQAGGAACDLYSAPCAAGLGKVGEGRKRRLGGAEARQQPSECHRPDVL